MSTIRIKPSDTDGTTGNLRFVVTDTETGKKVNLQARQIPQFYSSSMLLTPGTVLTCQYDRTQGGTKIYYKSTPTNDPDAWLPPINPFNGILLYPNEPENDWFEIPLSLSGAQMPSVITPPIITPQLYAAIGSLDFEYVEIPSSADQSTIPKVRVVSSPRGSITPTATVTVDNGSWQSGQNNSPIWLNGGGKLSYFGRGIYSHPTAVYAVFEDNTWKIGTNSFYESYFTPTMTYKIDAIW